MRVEHERDVNPPGPRPDIGEVRHPELIGAEPREVPVEEVSGPGLPRIRVDRTLPLPADHAGDAQLPHEAFDRAAGDVEPLTAQAEPELARAENLPLLPPRRQDDRLPPLVRHLPRRRAAPSGVVVGRWGDLHVVLPQHGADRLDTPPQPAITAVLMLVDERH